MFGGRRQADAWLVILNGWQCMMIDANVKAVLHGRLSDEVVFWSVLHRIG
jgi:hypothetical protein